MNLIFSLLLFLVGFYFVFDTYKKPSRLSSTDLKGYIAGFGFIYLSVISLLGMINLLNVFREILDVVISR
ncbi:MAG: hypothetical protein CFE24_03320 [Flavobacterium sp. BFFFF2]|nr:MAG: hypothetical protein CFE24_03320 [Flavobacterium sp. BFFFF2]